MAILCAHMGSFSISRESIWVVQVNETVPVRVELATTDCIATWKQELL